MPYPLILATNGDMFARVNPDGSWSVRWDRTLDIAYRTRQPPHQRGVWAYAKLLVAAKDNFFVTPWDVSETLNNEWLHYEAIIDYVDYEPSEDELLSTIYFGDQTIARVNFDGSWSVLWHDVLEMVRRTDLGFRAVALVGICQILKAAKDRFLTSPWDEPEDDE